MRPEKRTAPRANAEPTSRPAAEDNTTSVHAIARRLWPPPDTVNYAKCEAIARVDASDQKLQRALELRETADAVLFEDVGRLWIHPTRAEFLLALELAELYAAAERLSSALDLFASARSENSFRFYDERIRERQGRRP